jgi:hypothetical protein
MTRKLLGSYEILHTGTVTAHHWSVGQHQVVLKPAYYAGSLCPHGSAPAAARPPQFDSRYPATTDVVARDLGMYVTIVNRITEEAVV